MKNNETSAVKRKKILLVVLIFLALGYLVYESNVFFMSWTEHLMTNKIEAMINDK